MFYHWPLTNNTLNVAGSNYHLRPYSNDYPLKRRFVKNRAYFDGKNSLELYNVKYNEIFGTKNWSLSFWFDFFNNSSETINGLYCLLSFNWKDVSSYGEGFVPTGLVINYNAVYNSIQVYFDGNTIYYFPFINYNLPGEGSSPISGGPTLIDENGNEIPITPIPYQDSGGRRKHKVELSCNPIGANKYFRLYIDNILVGSNITDAADITGDCALRVGYNIQISPSDIASGPFWGNIWDLKIYNNNRKTATEKRIFNKFSPKKQLINYYTSTNNDKTLIIEGSTGLIQSDYRTLYTYGTNLTSYQDTRTLYTHGVINDSGFNANYGTENTLFVQGSLINSYSRDLFIEGSLFKSYYPLYIEGNIGQYSDSVNLVVTGSTNSGAFSGKELYISGEPTGFSYPLFIQNNEKNENFFTYPLFIKGGNPQGEMSATLFLKNENQLYEYYRTMFIIGGGGSFGGTNVFSSGYPLYIERQESWGTTLFVGSATELEEQEKTLFIQGISNMNLATTLVIPKVEQLYTKPLFISGF